MSNKKIGMKGVKNMAESDNSSISPEEREEENDRYYTLVTEADKEKAEERAYYESALFA